MTKLIDTKFLKAETVLSSSQSRRTIVFYTSIFDYFPHLINWLSLSCKDRALQISTIKRKKTFILGRALLAAGLDYLTGSKNYRLSYSSLGKPRIVFPYPWRFNLSHSGPHILLALQAYENIGIDCEDIHPRHCKRIIENVFTTKEQQAISQASNTILHFYKLWTQHEARIKYSGASVFSAPTVSSSLDVCSFQYENCVFSLCWKRKNYQPISMYHYQFSNQVIRPFFPEILK